MAALRCPHCGYDLSGTAEADGYGTRVCPECGGSSWVADVAMPWWMLSPWKFDGWLLLLGVPWGVVGFAVASFFGGWPWVAVVLMGSLGCAVVNAVGCVVGAAMGMRRRLGPGFVSGWAVGWHVGVSVVFVPVVWGVTVVVSRMIWRG